MLLTITLGLALAVASGVISSAIYAASMRNNIEESCLEAAVNSCEVIEGYKTEFVQRYKDKLLPIYSENREDLEEIEAGTITFETIDDRNDYFYRLTQDIFPPRTGFGLSYEMAEFNNMYTEILQNIDMVAYTNGLSRGCLWFYDAEHDNIVSMMDTSSEDSQRHYFPDAIVTAPDGRIREALKSGTKTSFVINDQCHAVCPVLSEDGTQTPIAFIYYYLSNAGISSGVRLFTVYTEAILLAAMIVISFLIMLFADRLIAKNVRKLSDAAEAFTSGLGSDTPEKISAEVGSQDEIGDLSGKFDLLQDTLLGYIDRLAEQTAKEEMMKAELSLAARIQKEALPKGRLTVGGIAMDSFLKPAREVGGDLYDYFMLDDAHLFFCLADVSGKGVPAALFMMRAKELIKAGVRAGRELTTFVREVNAELCSGNDECLFITAFFGILDIRTLKLSYLRAGHEQPLLRRGSEITEVGEESNYPLGLFDDADFLADEIMLAPGDTLLVFTDGLNEGINEKNEEFGYERIKHVLRDSGSDITGALFEALETFRGTAEQFDDVTMLVLSVTESLPDLDLRIKNPTFEDIPRVEDAIAEKLGGFDASRVYETGIIVDELMNNSISYAFEETPEPDLRVSLTTAQNEAELVFSDNGFPFDPLSIPEKTEEEKEEDTLGGEGISLVKALSESVSYRRYGDRNILTVRKDMSPPPDEG
ncbi:MAG: SpoIIE family protein phosphatase [Lachnospiraceae bacterium]|nr:SpoIIE family protein phosphatase [Lachnospiraceae bacterium]